MIKCSRIYSVITIACLVASCAGADHALPVVTEGEHDQAEQKIASAPALLPTTRTIQENEQIARRVAQKLQSAAGPICRSTERGRCWYTLQLRPEGVFNATVLKNQIVLYNGLAQYLETEDEFAAVLAHEMGHDIGGHYEKADQNRGIGAVIAGAIFAGVATAAGYDPSQAQSDMPTAMEVGAALGNISFSKEHEREADYIGAYLMTRAGYNPEAASSLWIKMTKASGHTKTALFDTHPSGPDRLAAWEETIEEVRYSRDLMPNLAGAEKETPLQVARVFDGSAVNSLPENSAVALAMKSYQPEGGGSSYVAALSGGTQGLVGLKGQPSTRSSWIAEGAKDNCGAPWAIKIERKGSEIRGNMVWNDAKYDVYGRLDHTGHTKTAHAGKNKEFQTTPAPRFFKLDITFEPNVARGSFAIDSSGAACGADFAMARVSS